MVLQTLLIYLCEYVHCTRIRALASAPYLYCTPPPPITTENGEREAEPLKSGIPWSDITSLIWCKATSRHRFWVFVFRRCLLISFSCGRDFIQRSCQRLSLYVLCYLWVVYVHNEELHNIYGLINIIRMITSRNMRLTEHAAWIGRIGMHIGYWWESQKERDH
jgi:hypothetical protein